MTYKETYTWLNRARRIEKELDEAKERYQRALDTATKNTPSYSAEPGAPTSDSHGKMDAVAILAESLNEYRLRIAYIKAEVTDEIKLLDDTNERRVLMFKFVDSMTMNEISEAMNYSREQCYRLIDRGVYHVMLNMVHNVT